MQLREGGTTRIYDGKRWHVAIGGSYICDGSHRPFDIRVFAGKGRGYIRPVGGPDFTFHIPKLPFYRAYKLRRVGGLVVYKVQTKILRKLALRPERHT